MIPTRILAAVALATFARAQLTTLSTIPVINGETVVVSLSTDAVGATVPVVIGTLSSAALSTAPVAPPGVTSTPVATNSAPAVTATTALPTSTALVVTNTVTTTTPRVVGQPGSTNADPGPTTYTYTTRDANGRTTIILDVFTPTYAYATSAPATTNPPGTILPYDVYTSLYGGGVNNNNQLNAARELAAFGTSALMCVIGGMALLL